MRLSTTRRSGFTLLEVLLAIALAIVLMAALYVALDIQLRLASAGRDQIEQCTIERALTQRFENDFTLILGPVAPIVSSSSSSTTTSTTATTGVTDAASTTDVIPFQAGVVGSFDTITIFVSRATKTDSGQADIRRITYWMTEQGLARQELASVTSEQVANRSTEVIEQNKESADYVIATEVTAIQFEYWDGSAWTESWDGSELGADGKTPKGPPSAIRVRLTIQYTGENQTHEIRHTIAVRSAAGPATSDADLTTTNE